MEATIKYTDDDNEPIINISTEVLNAEEDDGNDDADLGLNPLASTQWLRKLIGQWRSYVNINEVNLTYICHTSPDYVLRSNDHKFLKEVLHLYSPRSCPATADDDRYCDFVKAAAYVRRIELRHILYEQRMNDALEVVSREIPFQEL